MCVWVGTNGIHACAVCIKMLNKINTALVCIYISCHTSVCILSISNIVHFQPPQILRYIIRKRSEQNIIVLKAVSSKTT